MMQLRLSSSTPVLQILPRLRCWLHTHSYGSCRLLQHASSELMTCSRTHMSCRRALQVPAAAAMALQDAPSEQAALRSAAFASLGLTEQLLHALSELNLEEPTEVQAKAIPAILSRQDVLIASHTGSGKTLAYLLPLVHLLKSQELSGVSAGKPKRPRVLVLGPTRELTDQILQVAKSLSHFAKFRSACVNGAGTLAQQAASLAAPLDILVATPQKVLQHAQKGNLFYGDVQWLVLDEADTMLDRDFGDQVQELLGPLRSKAEPAKVVLVAATLTKDVKRLVRERFPAMISAETSSLHKGVAGAKHSFVTLKGTEDKLAALVQVLRPQQRRGQRTMVFCNTLDSCRAAEMYLQEADLPTCCYHGDVPLDGRKEAIAQFAAGDSGEGEQPVMVCTDLAARGLDIPGHVDHIVNFDFPRNPVDYIHRSGRTARAGQQGQITSLVYKGDQVLAGRIERALQKGLALDELSADKRSLPPDMRPKPETLQRRVAERKEASRKGLRGAQRFEEPDSKSRSAGRGQASRGRGTGRGAGRGGGSSRGGPAGRGASKAASSSRGGRSSGRFGGSSTWDDPEPATEFAGGVGPGPSGSAGTGFRGSLRGGRSSGPGRGSGRSRGSFGGSEGGRAAGRGRGRGDGSRFEAGGSRSPSSGFARGRTTFPGAGRGSSDRGGRGGPSSFGGRGGSSAGRGGARGSSSSQRGGGRGSSSSRGGSRGDSQATSRAATMPDFRARGSTHKAGARGSSGSFGSARRQTLLRLDSAAKPRGGSVRRPRSRVASLKHA